MGADTLRIEVKWNEVAPEPSAQDQAELRRLRPGRLRRRPNAYPGLRPLRRPDRARARARLPDHRHDHRRRAALGDRRAAAAQRRDRRTGRCSAGEYGQLRGRGREALLRQLRRPAARSATSRSGTSPTTATSSSRPRSAPRIYRNMVDAAMPADPRNGRSGARRSSSASWRRSGARRGDGPDGVPAQVAVPQQALQAHEPRRRLPQLQEDRRGRLRAPPLRPHRARAEDARRDQHARDPPARQVPRPGARRASASPRNLPIYNTEFGLQSNPPDRLVSTSLVAPGGADQREGGVRLPLLAAEEPLAVPAVRRPARAGPAAREVVGLPDRPAVRERQRRSRRTTRTVPDRREEARPRRLRSGAGCGPGSGRRSVQLQRKGGGNSGPRIKTNWGGYFGKSFSRSGHFRFRAYDRNRRYMGTSRTASPIG